MKKLIYILFPIAMISCSNQAEPMLAADLINWSTDEGNGLLMTKSINGVDYSAQYKPVEFIVANEQKSNDIKEEVLAQRSEELKGMHYFNFRIKADGEGDVLMKGLSNEQEYFQRVNYCSFEMKEDLHLVTGEDTLNCQLFNFVRTHGVAPYVDFVLAFNNPTEEVEDLQLIYNERMFGAGKLKFTIEKESLNNIPELITN